MKAHLRFPILVAAAVLGLVAGVRTRLEVERTRAAQAAVATQQNEITQKLQVLQQQLPSANGGALVTEETSAMRPVVARRASTGQQKEDAETAAGNPPNAEVRLVDRPKQAAQYAANLREHFGLQYGGLFRLLRLSPAEVEKFTDLLVWLEMSRLDLWATEQAQKLEPATSAKVWRDWGQMRNAKLDEMLGERANQFRRFEENDPVYDLARRLASTEAFADTSLTAEQIDRVSEILAANSQRRRIGQRTPVIPGTVDWNSAREQLRDVLNPTLLETLGYFVESENASAKANDVRRRLTAELRKTP